MCRRTCRRSGFLILALAFHTLGTFAQSGRPGWGATPFSDAAGSGVTFRVWAPNATSVFVPGQFNSWSTTATPLAKEFSGAVWNGVWSADVVTASVGQQYKYYINYSGGSVWKHDPRSREVTTPGASGNDFIYNPTNFNWQGDHFDAPALDDLFIYELHIGTFPKKATPNRFVAATNQLDYIKSLGVNAVEVMPIAEFGNAGDSWGYDPAQLFAVDNGQYGGPDAFKTFVQACHARGLAVLLDVVHNHYGTGDLDMWDFDGWAGSGPIGGGIYFNQSNTNLEITPYGDTRPNFSSSFVDSFVQDNFSMWLDEYHLDGFRWDTPGLMMNAANYGYIASAGNLINSINSMIHSNYPGKISIAEDVYNSFGFDSAWDTSYPYSVIPVLTNTLDANRNMAVISNAVAHNVRYSGAAGSVRAVFLESHDVVGDLNGGVRLVTAIDAAAPASYRARKVSTLGAVVTLTAPGVPMIFQGQEMLENQAFDSSRPVDWSKTNTYSFIVQFYRDLIGARRNLYGYTPGLEGDQCNVVQADNARKLVAFERWSAAAPSEKVMVIANFSGAVIDNYTLKFPSSGNWYIQLNSDSTNYGSDYGNAGGSVVPAVGNPASSTIDIGPYSALILSQIPNSPPNLTIISTNASMSIAWPSAYFGWSLESTTNLAVSHPVWSAIPASQYQTNAATVSTELTPLAASAFYRLHNSSPVPVR